jgi:hypothetical protein
MSDHDLHVDDAQLLARLRRIADTVDPVPDDVVELGRAAFELRHADGILMALVTEGLSEAAVRDGGEPGTASHLIVFAHERTSIEIEVSRRNDFARVIGVVMDGAEPYAVGSEVVLETTASQTRVALDDGRFTFERVPLGLARLVLDHDGQRVMTTPWFEAR